MSKYQKPYTLSATLDHARPCPCCKRPAKKVTSNGVTYSHPYGFFCSQPCAVYYANNGEALNFHGKLFNELVRDEPITLGVFEHDH